MRKEGDDVGVAVPPGCFKEGHAEVRGPFLVHIRLMRNPQGTYRPQTLVKNLKIISAVFAGLVISERFGKLSGAWILDGEQVRGYSKNTLLIANLGQIKGPFDKRKICP